MLRGWTGAGDVLVVCSGAGVLLLLRPLLTSLPGESVELGAWLELGALVGLGVLGGLGELVGLVAVLLMLAVVGAACVMLLVLLRSAGSVISFEMPRLRSVDSPVEFDRLSIWSKIESMSSRWRAVSSAFTVGCGRSTFWSACFRSAGFWAADFWAACCMSASFWSTGFWSRRACSGSWCRTWASFADSAASSVSGWNTGTTSIAAVVV